MFTLGAFQIYCYLPMESIVYGTSVLEHMWENIVWKDRQPILFNAQGSVGVKGDTVKAELVGWQRKVVGKAKGAEAETQHSRVCASFSDGVAWLVNPLV